MKHIIFIASILSLSSLVHAIGSQQLLMDLSKLQEINFSVIKQKSLSLPAISSSLISDEKLAEIIKSIQLYYPKLNLISKSTLNTSNLTKAENLQKNGTLAKLYESQANSSAFLVLFKSEFDRIFGFFVPTRF